MKIPIPNYHHDEGGCCGGAHHHEHHDSHNCGHDHSHNHSHGGNGDFEPEDAFCQTCGKNFAECVCHLSEEITRAVYTLENLGCANCAAKMEHKIRALPGVEHAAITFATKQLCLSAREPARFLPAVQSICASIESEVRVVPRERSVKKKESAAPVSFWQKEGNKELVSLAVGAFFFVIALILSALNLPSLPLFIVAYLVLGKDILVDAVKSVTKGHALDENFLMAIASLGAFFIGEYTEAVAVVLFFCVGEIFEERAVAKSRSQIIDAVDMRPETVNICIGDGISEIPAEDVVVGDILLVRPGDRIPLDGIVAEGESRLDTSPVTGEPVPVAVVPGSEIFSGCINTNGVLKLKVTKPLEESMVTRILDAVEQAAAGKPKIDRFITRFARVYTPCVVALAVATAVIPSLLTGNWQQWVYTALTFLVISCPCALVLSVPLAYFSGIGVGSRYGILFKGGAALEALKDARIVVMDKTGTLTKGNFSVVQILCEKGFSKDDVLAAAASAELSSTHPIGSSIVAAAGERSLELVRSGEVEEIPGRGIKASYCGKEVLCGNRKFVEEGGVALPERDTAHYGTEAYVCIDGRLAGVIFIADIIKEDAKAAVAEMHALGLSAVMLTGDRKAAAAAVAKETGVDSYCAGLLPHDKLASLDGFRKERGAVMFVGDGINDAPVLAGADVGAAMGSGADAAIEAADVVFMSSEVQAVPLAIRIARKVGRVAMENVIFALAVKFGVMILGLCGFANMWFAIFADTGVAILCILNSIRILYGSVR